MRRVEQLNVEAAAYLRLARRHARWAMGGGSAQSALHHIAETRDALHEAASRLAELQRLQEAPGDDIPF